VGALGPGDEFPNLTLESVDGTVRLSERWAGGPLVIVFMRHFGCAFCREHLIRLGRAYEEIKAAGGEVVAAFQYRAEPTRNFCRSRGVPFDCLGDPKKEGYRAVGLGRGGVKEYLGPKVWLRWPRAARVGAHVGKPQGDVAQRPGTFVVDTDGRVVFAHYNSDSTDNPKSEVVVEAVRQAAGVTPQPR
jgi:peroxiredoxin